MSTIVDIVEFKSSKFEPVLPEESQVNPEVYGAELAYWVSIELARRGLAPMYPGSEDWGWYVEWFTEAGSEFALHCTNIEGAKDRWHISLRRHARKLFGRDKPPFTEAEALVKALKEALDAEDSVEELKWHDISESVT